MQRLITRAILSPHQSLTRGDAMVSVVKVVLPPPALSVAVATESGIKTEQKFVLKLLKFIMMLNAFAFRYIRKKSLLTIIHIMCAFHLRTFSRDVMFFWWGLIWSFFPCFFSITGPNHSKRTSYIILPKTFPI